MNARCGDPSLLIRAPTADERDQLLKVLAESWGSTTIISRNRAHDTSLLPTLVALQAGSIVGVATYRVEALDCELVTLDAFVQGGGIGSALLQTVQEEAFKQG